MKIVSWNIQGERERWSRGHTGRITNALSALNADVYALQEVHRGTWKSRGIDQFGAIAESTGMQGVFAETMASGEAAYGLAIFAKQPVLESHSVPLGGRGEPRKALVSRLEELTVIVTHLAAWGRLMRKTRSQQVARLVELISDHERVVLAGDFNAHPESPELAPLRSSGVLIPCFDAHPITHPFSGGSLDSVLVSPGVRFLSAACGTQRVSDHLPLLVTLEPAP